MNSVPCILLTGFLGSGKTTFLNWLLNNHSDKKISVILNEFGDIKLESNFVRHHTENIVELANGCMCCVAKADLPRVINYILENSPTTEYILIEASGLSDPDPIHDSFAEPAISDKVYLGTIICLVDALNFEKNRIDHKIISNQIADCDTLIISKTSLVSPAELLNLKEHLIALLPNTQILEFSQSLDPHIFLNSLPAVSKSTAVEHLDHTHEEYQSWWYLPTSPLDSQKLKLALMRLPDSIIRAKGFFKNTAGEKQLLQFVGKSVEIIPDHWDSGEASRTALLFIGKELNHQVLQSILDQARA